MKKYFVYVDTACDGVQKIGVIASSESGARVLASRQCEGDVVAVKESDWTVSLDYVREVLNSSRFGQIEIDWIMQALEYTHLFN